MAVFCFLAELTARKTKVVKRKIRELWGAERARRKEKIISRGRFFLRKKIIKR